VCCCDVTASFLVAKVWSEVFAHFHVVALKHHGSYMKLTVWPDRINYL
jgi:hypothetical protein